jgi:ankyrin repeat protein
MVETFRAADYFSLKDKYMWGATDLPTYKTSISIDGRTKEVVDYAGQQVGMPESVSKLEETIDRLSGVERWTKGNGETVPALMQEKFDFTSPKASEFLANVAQRGNAEAVRDLIAAGVIVSTEPVQPRLGMPGTALENAAQRGDVEMLRGLLSAGIKDPDAKTEALRRASSAGKMDAIRLLIGSGANPTATDVLIQASASGIPAVVQEILKYKPDANSRGQDGTTALIACLQAYHYKDKDVNLREVVRMLVDAGADPNLADNKGKTPLIANSRDLEIAQMLVAHGANVNAQASDGFTPLLNAGTVELTRFLLEHGADPFAKTDHGQSALDWAKQMNRKDQAALLEAAMARKKP